MRIHIQIDEDVVSRIDAITGPRGRSAFIRQAVRAWLEQEERWRLIESAWGSIPDHGHDRDDDPAEWVRRQRFADPHRIG